MQSIFVLQLTALLISTSFQVFFVVISRKISRKHWETVYLITICVLGSLLSLRAWLVGKWFELFVAAVFLAGGIYCIYSLRHKIIHLVKTINLLHLLVGIPILFELFWAAFPNYRYDQWTYHLLISKLISKYNGLEQPMFDDHIYFSGVYEFIFLLPRLFISNDLLMHGFSNSFSLLSVLILTVGLLKKLASKLHIETVWPLALFAFVSIILFYSLPEREAIINTKPDIFLYLLALLALHWCSGLNVNNASASFFLGLILFLGFSLKVTWLHFFCAVSIVIFFRCVWPKERPRINFKAFIKGVVLGGSVALPILAKNYYFFGNPLHPVELTSFFPGSLNSHFMVEYWQLISGKAQSPVSYLKILSKVPFYYIHAGQFLLLIFALLGLMLIRQKKLNHLLKIYFWLPIVTAVIYMFLWPIFYKAGIYPRFVFAGVAIFSFLTMQIMVMSQQKWVILLCLLVIIMNSSIDVKVLKMKDFIFDNTDTFFTVDRKPYKFLPYSKLINHHRMMTFGKIPYHSAIVVSDGCFGYFLDGAIVHNEGYMMNTFIGKNPQYKQCPWLLYKDLRINYFYLYSVPYIIWPEIFQPGLQYSIALDPKSKVKFLDPNTIDQHILNDCKTN